MHATAGQATGSGSEWVYRQAGMAQRCLQLPVFFLYSMPPKLSYCTHHSQVGNLSL